MRFRRWRGDLRRPFLQGRDSGRFCPTVRNFGENSRADGVPWRSSRRRSRPRCAALAPRLPPPVAHRGSFGPGASPRGGGLRGKDRPARPGAAPRWSPRPFRGRWRGKIVPARPGGRVLCAGPPGSSGNGSGEEAPVRPGGSVLRGGPPGRSGDGGGADGAGSPGWGGALPDAERGRIRIASGSGPRDTLPAPDAERRGGEATTTAFRTPPGNRRSAEAPEPPCIS